jgi:UDP-GlcNAc:undecaprenyl-phosphate GlcNAc-1-phosphate transferase
MVAGALVPLLLWLPMEREYVATLLGMAIILVFGVWDDRVELDPRTKFIGQFIAVAMVVLGGGVVIDRLPFTGYDALPLWFSVPFTMFAILGVTNAINLADGLDGLAGGTTLLSLAGVALLAYAAGGSGLVLLVVAVSGGVLGFLRYNSWPAQIFMGDGGSQFLGFSLAVAVILLTQDVHSAMSPMIALFLIGLPILDTMIVMSRRLREGRSPFSADKNHLHHRLLDLNLDHYEAVAVIYVVQGLFVVLGFTLRYESDLLLVLIYAGFIAGALFLCRLRGRRLNRDAKRVSRQSMPFRFVQWLRKTGWSARGPFIWVNVSVAALFVVVAALASDVPGDFGFAAWLLFAAMAVVTVQQRYPMRWLEQLVLYCTSAFVVYLLTVSPGALSDYQTVADVYLLVLAVVVMLGIRFTRGRSFRVTPLDILVLFLVLTVPNLAVGDLRHIGMGAAKLIVLLYAVEFVLGMVAQPRWALRVATLGSLAVLGLKGVIG